jgi:hypothetical protein
MAPTLPATLVRLTADTVVSAASFRVTTAEDALTAVLAVTNAAVASVRDPETATAFDTVTVPVVAPPIADSTVASTAVLSASLIVSVPVCAVIPVKAAARLAAVSV